LKSTLTLAQTLGNKAYQISALNSLANALTSRAQLNYRRAQSAQRRQDIDGAKNREQSAKSDDDQALNYLASSLSLAQDQKDASAQMRSLLSVLPIYTRQKDEKAKNITLQQAVSLWEALPNTRSRIYAGIDLARFLQSSSCTANPAEAILQKATDSAIQDHRAESFALGALGKLYECRGTPTQALEVTQQAMLVAEQDLKAKDSLYQWEWQTGRILKALNREPEAIAAYNRSVNTLATIRSDILSANRDLQFDFRDTIEPIYRGLIALQLSLKDKPTSQNNEVQSAKLKRQDSKSTNGSLDTVLNTMDSLRLAELQNYFGSECNIIPVGQTNASSIQTQPGTAILNSIILGDNTVMILRLPDQALLRSPVNVSQDKLEQKVNAFRQRLEDYTDKAPFNLQESKELYDLLIKPFAPVLKEQNITTLVFVQDGILRSIPMAALHDGKQFLVENYAIATTPSLSLTTLTPLNRGNLQALGLGITQATIVEGKSFLPLKYVKGEIDGLVKQLPGSQGSISPLR
jgi:tetratricopeptide (TPR) repeat protein